MSGRKSAVPWLDWIEWQDVHVGLFSSDPYEQQRVVSRVAAWRSRVQLPVAIDATAQLVELQLHEQMAQNHHHAVGVSSRSHTELSLLYSNVVVRCVNGLVDGSQKGVYATAVSTLAQRIGIPLWVVDLRHESTHNQLPSLPVLRFAARHLLAWLRANYWTAQEVAIRDQVHHVARWLLEQLPHLKKHEVEEMQVGAGDVQMQEPLESEEMEGGDVQMQEPLKPILDVDNLRNLVVPLLVAGEQYGERVTPTGLLFLEAPPLLEEIFQKETFVSLLLQLQPLWRSFSASLLARLCRTVFDAICSKSHQSIYDEKVSEEVEQTDTALKQTDTALKQHEVEMALQWTKFMVSSEYRERIKLQIGPIEDLCQCGAEMLALAEKLKVDNTAGDDAELLERMVATLKSARGIRNHPLLGTEVTIAASLSVDSSSRWTQLSGWSESPIGLHHCYTSYHNSNQSQVCESGSLEDDSLTPDSTTFVVPDEEEDEDINTDAEDAEKAIDALMEDLDVAYDSDVQRCLELQTTIARDGLRQGASTVVLPKQELQRIQEEIEIW